MRHSRRLVSIALFLSLVVTGFSIVAAHEPEPASGDVRITIKIKSGLAVGEQASRTYQLLATPGRNNVRLHQGFRVPIPTTSFNTQDSKDGSIVPVTSFSYQNVGFSAVLEVQMTAAGRIHIKGRVEDSSLANKESYPGQPIIATVNQDLNVTLKDGESTRIGWVENSEFGSMFLEITAEILD